MSANPETFCFHCGDPVPAGCLLQVEIDGTARPMCCPGCQAVAALIAGSGLQSFYRLRTDFNRRPLPEPADSYGIYDNPDNCADFVEALEDGGRRARLLLGGVNCAACTWLIENALLRSPGVGRATVNLAQQSLSVEWRPKATSLSGIFSQLSELGYDPHPWRARQGAELVMREQRAALRQLAVAGLAMMQVGMFAVALHAGDLQGIALEHRSLLRWVSLIIATLVVTYAAQSFFRNAWLNLRRGVLVMDLPVALAIGLAYAASAWATLTNSGQVYFDSVAMFTFFLLLGRFLERRVRQREMLRQTDLQSLLPASCLRLREGHWETVPTRSIAAGDTLQLRPGEVIPADGMLIEGGGSVDEAAFSGEHFPRTVGPGDRVAAGTLLLDGSARLSVTAGTGDSRIAGLLRVLALAEHQKPRLARLADRVAAWFVAAVLLLAAAVASYWLRVEPENALWITLAVLVVSCPCALALATPTALAAAAAGLRRRGVLLTGENALEQLQQCTLVLFDKTGTLTRGVLSRGRVVTAGAMSAEDCLLLAAALEQQGNHPIAAAFADIQAPPAPAEPRVYPGRGVRGRLRGREYAIGSAEFVAEFCGDRGERPTGPGHWIALADRDSVLAWIELVDEARPESAAVVAALNNRGLRVELLSGDSSGQVALLAERLRMDDHRAGHTPEMKLEYIRACQLRGETVAMVGDGLNDAPVLAAADCAIAVNEATDLAKSRADAVLLGRDLRVLLTAFDTAHRTRRCILQNMGWALAYNGLAVPLAAMGLVPPWAAAIGMSLSSLLVVGNSLRLH